MRFTYAFRGIPASDPLKAYARRKLTAVARKFARRPIEAHVVFERNGIGPEVQCHLIAGRVGDFAARERHENWYAAVDGLAEKLARQLKRRKDLRTQHHTREPEPDWLRAG